MNQVRVAIEAGKAPAFETGYDMTPMVDGRGPYRGDGRDMRFTKPYWPWDPGLVNLVHVLLLLRIPFDLFPLPAEGN